MSKTVIIRNVELNFVHLQREHSPFGQPIWDTQVVTSDMDTVKQLMDAGVKMKKQDDGTFKANVKRNVMNRKGEKNTPVTIVDSNKQPIPEGTTVGNGTIANLKLFSYDWSVGGKSGTSAMLSAVQVMKLVEYNGGDTTDFDVEDASGF